MRRLPLHSRSGCLLMLALSMTLATLPVQAQTAAPHVAGHAKSHVKAAKQPVEKAEARTPAPAKTGDQFADGIAAVVDKDVITMSEVNAGVAQAEGELRRRHVQVPPLDIMQRQVLNRLIADRVMEQEAKRQGISVTDADVDQAIQMIASRNHITVAQLKTEVLKTGIDWDGYRKSIRGELVSTRLRQRVVESNVHISDSEIDAFLNEYSHNSSIIPPQAPAAPGPAPAAAQPQVRIVPNGPVELAQILVRVPDGASADVVAKARQKAEDLLARLHKGADFAGLAASSSDGPEALHGGLLGVRPLDGWPDLFVNAIRNLMPGQVTGLIRSGNGFHIVKVVARAMERVAGAASPQPQQAPPPDTQQVNPIPPDTPGAVEITQTHARHILIKTSAVMTDAEARQKLEEIRQRIVSGQATFEDMARQYSQDSTAPQGGDLGWLDPGETVPAFEAAMNKLKPGEISEPVSSPFGWHLIEVVARRQHDATQAVRRNRARQILLERRAEPAFEDYMDQVQAQTYIDNRLEKQAELKQRYQQ